MIIVLLLFFVAAGWRFGNWKEFHLFYPTLLFFIIGDLLSQFLLYDYSMWEFQPVGPLDKSLNLNHTTIALLKMLIQYTATIAIFIGRLPETLRGRILWVLFWTAIFGTTEGLFQLAGNMAYYHGWHFGWDIAFNIMMFSLLIIHHKRPIYAWIISAPVIIGLLFLFDVPYSVFK